MRRGMFDIGNVAAELTRETKQQLEIINARLLVMIDLLEQLVDAKKEED
jgi:hypothetical protein